MVGSRTGVGGHFGKACSGWSGEARGPRGPLSVRLYGKACLLELETGGADLSVVVQESVGLRGRQVGGCGTSGEAKP